MINHYIQKANPKGDTDRHCRNSLTVPYMAISLSIFYN